MASIGTIEQILNRLEHLDREKGDDFMKLKKIVLSSTKDEITSVLNELDLKNTINLFKKLLKSDEKYVSEDLTDIFNHILETFGANEFYSKFESLIKNDILGSDCPKLKSIHLKLLLNCCLKDVKVQTNLINSDMLSVIIENMGDRNEEVGQRSIEILQHLSTKVDRFLEDYLFNQTNQNQLKRMKNKNEINEFRYFEFFINLVLIKETFLQNQFVQEAIKEVIDLAYKSADPIIIRNCLVILDKLIENNKGIDYLEQFGFFNFINNKITNSQPDLFINLLMPGYLETFAKLGSTVPELISNHQNVITQIIEFILVDNFTPQCIESIALIGRLAKGKLILNENQKFIEHCLPKLGQLLCQSSAVEVEVLHCLSSLFDLNDLDATVKISTLLETWYSKLMVNRRKISETIFVLCKQVFPEIHLNTLNLIRILCKHEWGQKEFAQLGDKFLDYILNRSTEVDYDGKQAKFKLITELATSPFTTKTFGGLNHAKIRKIYKDGAFFVETDISVAVEGV